MRRLREGNCLVDYSSSPGERVDGSASFEEKIKLDLSSLRGLRVRTRKPSKPLSPNLGFHHGVSSLQYLAGLRQYRKRAATFKGSEYHRSPESVFVGYEDEWCCNQMCN